MCVYAFMFINMCVYICVYLCVPISDIYLHIYNEFLFDNLHDIRCELLVIFLYEKQLLFFS